MMVGKYAHPTSTFPNATPLPSFSKILDFVRNGFTTRKDWSNIAWTPIVKSARENQRTEEAKSPKTADFEQRHSKAIH